MTNNTLAGPDYDVDTYLAGITSEIMSAVDDRHTNSIGVSANETPINDAPIDIEISQATIDRIIAVMQKVG
jgi:hypothetical protein